MLKKNWIVILLPLFILSFVNAKEGGVEKCTKITGDRKRLQCFDLLFKTPVLSIGSFVDDDKGNGISSLDLMPEEWLQAWKKEEKRGNSDRGFIETITPGNFQESIFLTKPIENIGLVVLSCVDKISRVELMLDKPVDDGIVSITIDGQKISKEKWLSDDTGFILRMGRGIPSINEMKNILNKESIVIGFDRLSTVVDVSDLTEKIKPLRNSCRW